MALEIRILQITDVDAVSSFERERLKAQPSFIEKSDIELEMEEWHAPWRKEALEYYLPLGWSFSVWSENKLVGYFLGQPQVFTRGLTQTLWLERLIAPTQNIADQLIELAYRVCKEKHFQKLIIRMPLELSEITTGLPFRIEKHQDNLFEIKTSRYE